MTPEGIVKDAIKKWLTERSAWFFLPVSNGYGTHGIPDFISCVPLEITPSMVGMTLGVFVGIEAKADGKRKGTTTRQKLQLLGIEKAAGVSAVVSHQNDLSELEGLLNALLTGTKGSCLPFETAFPDSGRDSVCDKVPGGRAGTRRRATSTRRDTGTA